MRFDLGLLKLWRDRPERNAILQELGARSLYEGLGAENEREREKLLQIRIVMTSTKGIYTGMVAAVLVAVAAQSQLTGTWFQTNVVPWVWCALMLLGLFTGSRIEQRFRRLKNAQAQRRQGLKFIGFSVYCAAMWGTTSWVLLPGKTAMYEFFLIAGVALVMMGTAGAQAVYRPLVLSFAVPVSVIFSAGLLRFEDTLHVLMGVGIALLSVTIVAFTKVQEDAVKAAIRLGFESERLLLERTEQQALIEQARFEAEHANASKTTFLAAAGHDLRQPMHALVQYVGQLKRHNRDASLDDTVHRIGSSLDAMQDLLDSILEVSKLMMGAVRPVVSSFPLARVLDRLDVQLWPMAQQKGLELKLITDDSVVETDEVLLERILRNLALNAIRYTPAGGVRVRCRRRGAVVRVQVWDSGVGIAHEERENIFETFYQIGNVARDRHKGLGLGLSLVKQLSDLLACRIHLRSVPGKGTMFAIDVPLASVHSARPADPEAPPRPDFVRGATVLVIDDDKASLDATASTLRAFGCEVLSAMDAGGAVELLEQRGCMPQLVLSDHRLADGENGIGAIQAVLAQQRAQFGDDVEVAAMLLSGDTAPQVLHAVQRAGYTMLHKPLKPDALYRAINDTLERLATTAPG